MAHKTKDGKKEFTNRSMAAQYDRRNAGHPQDNAPEHEDPENDGAPEMNEDQMENPDGAQMAAEHGPAHEIHIQHDEGSNMHMVRVAHPDGHEHQSQHGSVGAAHKYADDCAGGGME